jgi:minor extracellular protease Epr
MQGGGPAIAYIARVMGPIIPQMEPEQLRGRVIRRPLIAFSCLLAALTGFLPIRASSQTQDVAALRRAIAASGGRVLVLLKSGSGAALRVAGAPSVSPSQMQTIEQRLGRQYAMVVRGRSHSAGTLFATVDDSALTRLLADPNVDLVEPDFLVRLATTERTTPIARAGRVTPTSPRVVDDPAITWGDADVGAPQAWAAGITGAGVKVGIIDGGIDYTHPYLNVVGGYDFTTGSSSPAAYTDNVPSCDGHGTHVAGTVGAKHNNSQVVGVAPDVQLYALKVFQDFGAGCLAWSSDQMSALDWAATNGLKVVNMSLGGPGSSVAYQMAVTNAIAAGVTIVAAAGNDAGGAIDYPAAYSGVVAVGALDQGNTPAGYESVGPQMLVAAPGSNVLSTLPGGGVGLKSGTSMASPHVVGVVALLVQAHPTWTVAQIQAALQSMAADIYTAGFDNYTGWGLVQAPTSGGGTVPLAIAVTPSARSVSVQQGNAAPSDNATVTITGTNASTTAWSATKKRTWLTFTNSSGSGSGSVTWTRNASGLAVGTYVDTITVTSVGITGSPATVYDTLKITAAPIPVVMAVSPAARSVSVQQGNAAPSDNATVTLTGTNAASTAWTATKRQAWLTFTNSGGIGSGSVTWTRNASGLAVGTYVDTITVASAGITGSPATVYDTLKITAAPIPVVMAVSPAARSVSVQQGNAAPSDNATVTLTGTNAANTAWAASKRQAWLTFTNSGGIGSGSVTWTRNASGLAVGTYVDTITVTSVGITGSPATVYDTLKITAAPIPVVMAVSPAARSVSVQQGNAAPSDNATVTLTGTNAASTAWTATKRQAWLTFTNSGGIGSGSVTWTRNASGLAVGTYVDTITVASAGITGSPATVYDTLKITAAPIPVVMAVSPAARSVSVQQGNAAPNDNATVTLTGTNASTTSWTAAKKQAWLTFTNASGSGSGSVTWNRNASGLAVGTYVDTITVASAGITGSPATVYDTLKITAAPIPVVMAVSPAARSVSVQQGNAAPSDNATVTLTGTNASTTSWTATKKQAWLTLTITSGTGSGPVTWNRNASGLAVGTYVDTITVASAGITGSPATIYDSLKITAAPVLVVMAVSPAARSVSVQQGNAAPSDNAMVTLTGTNAASTSWAATKRQAWLTFTNASGSGSGNVTWNRNASGLAVGTYVDTITVASAGITGSPATVYDTLKITAAPIPVVMAVSPVARSVSVQQGNAAPSDNATVTLTGTNAASTTWTATNRRAWLNFTSGSGTGSGTVAWSLKVTGLAVGIYVDTITVAASGVTGSPILIFDTLKITAVTPTIALAPHGRMVRSVQLTGGPKLSLADIDSAMVEASVPDSIAAGGWIASVSSSRLVLVTSAGSVNSYVKWSRPPQAFDPGMYVDTLSVLLVRDSSVAAQFIDSLEVVDVTVPVPDAAVGDLFDHASLTADQRVALDRQGNNNGVYDLGDFLAWVTRNGIHLSTATSLKLKQAALLKSAPAPTKPGPAGP